MQLHSPPFSEMFINRNSPISWKHRRFFLVLFPQTLRQKSATEIDMTMDIIEEMAKATIINI